MFTRSKTLLIFALLMLAANTVFAEGGFRKPVVYLTFDDGPSADNATEDLLELLARYGAEATFFVTGQRANKEPEKISAILYAGHSLGNHSHTHVSLVSETREGIEVEFSKTNDAILAAGGPPLTCYRPPFGATDSVVKSVGSELGMALVKWSIDTRDWEPSVEGDRIIRTLNSVEDGSIVLMHDGPTRRGKSIAALSDWMELNAHRYQFNALPQCKPYGISNMLAASDDHEIDLQLEQESIHSLLEKLRSYRFDLQGHESEQARVDALYIEKLTARIF